MDSTIVGGQRNVINGSRVSTIVGGIENKILGGDASSVGGGEENFINSEKSKRNKRPEHRTLIGGKKIQFKQVVQH
jgi:hypothetical protein